MNLIRVRKRRAQPTVLVRRRGNDFASGSCEQAWEVQGGAGCFHVFSDLTGSVGWGADGCAVEGEERSNEGFNFDLYPGPGCGVTTDFVIPCEGDCAEGVGG